MNSPLLPDAYSRLLPYQQTLFIKRALTAWYAKRAQQGRVLTFVELSDSTGQMLARYMDFYAQFLWPMDAWRCVAYEIKISLRDYQAELAAPDKRQAALALSTEYYFAAPPGLIAVGTLPPEAGLVEVYPDGRIKVRHKAPQRTMERPHWGFVAALTRKAAGLDALAPPPRQRRRYSAVGKPRRGS